MNVICSHSRELSRFGEAVVTDVDRSIGLINAIEETVSAVEWIAARLFADAKFAITQAECIAKDPYDKPIDQDGSLDVELLAAQNHILNLYNTFLQKRMAARQDHQLTAEDGVEDCYTRAIEAAADLHNAINDLRWGINEHDASLQKVASGRVLTTPDEVEAFLSQL